ncbi:MAG TPA: hypothetical protein PLL10_01965, partial [Elusimicrobiales bacterium]|nr:hypothetical protein [Elusimicrobiales bacterium]
MLLAEGSPPRNNESAVSPSDDRLFVFLALVLWLFCVFCLYSPSGNIGFPFDLAVTAPQGVYLTQGLLNNDISWNLPLYQVLVLPALLLQPGQAYFLELLFLLAVSLLLLECGRQLRGIWFGMMVSLVSAAVLNWDRMVVPEWQNAHPENMFMLFILSFVAYALVLRGREPQRRMPSELFLAAAIGINFMTKSSLIFLPFVLAAYDLLSGKLKRKETSWKLLAVLCAGPFVMLLPWCYMNYAKFNEFVLFESYRADDNIITGALGLSCTVEGSYPLAGLQQGDNILLWAAKTVFSQPLVYLFGVLQRFYLAFTWYPGYFAAFLAAAIRFRRDERIRLLSVFVAYFVIMHVLLSVQRRYFFPILPVLILGSCGLLLSFFRNHPIKNDLYSHVVPGGLFLPLLIGYGVVSLYLFRYPYRAVPAYEAAKLSSGISPQGLKYAAEENLLMKDANSAYRNASRAVLACPSRDLRRSYVRVLSARGGVDVRPVLRQNLLECEEMPHICFLLKAAGALEKKQYEECRWNFYLAYLARKSRELTFNVNGLLSQHDVSAFSRQQSAGGRGVAEKLLFDFYSILPPANQDLFKKKILNAPLPRSIPGDVALESKFSALFVSAAVNSKIFYPANSSGMQTRE